MRPVLDTFEPFTIERVGAIRASRLRDLADPEKKSRASKSRSPSAAGPRLDNRTKEVIAGLDPKTQEILMRMLRKKA